MEPNLTFHYNVLSLFNEEYYKGILTAANLKEEIALGPDKDDKKVFWSLEKNKTKYLIPAEVVDALPLKIKDTEELINHSRVYHILTQLATIKYKAEKCFEFREMVDGFAPFKHTNPDQFLVYKLIALTAYLSRINVRVSTPASFGKDSLFSIINLLRNDVAIINPRSAAAVEYRLHGNRALVLNELSNLEAGQQRLLQEFLLLAGDFKNQYEKPTRGNTTYETFDTYDISNLSLVIFYNIYDYYLKAGQQDRFFDRIFTKAIHDRFLPFQFGGELDVGQFNGIFNAQTIADRNKDYYIKLIHTLQYFQEQFETMPLRWAYDTTKFDLRGRHTTSFERIVRTIGLYAKDQAEFDALVALMYDCHLAYEAMMGRSITWMDTGKAVVREEILGK